MEQTFTYTPGWRIFLYAFVAIFFGGAITTFYFAIQPGNGALPLVGAGLVLTFIGVYYFRITKNYKLIISEHHIVQVGAFGTKEVALADVAGYTMVKNRFFLKSAGGTNLLTIGDTSYVGNTHELVGWIRKRFDNLDDKAYNQQLDEILDNREIAFSHEERVDKLKSAKTICSWFNGIGMAIAFWLFLAPRPYDVAVSVAMLFPLAVIYVQYRFRNLIRLDDDNRKSAYPSLLTAFLFPSMGLLLRTILDFDLLKFTDCIVPVVLIALPLAIIFVLLWNNTQSKPQGKAGSVLIMAFFVLLYAYTSCIAINCNFDYSRSQVYPAKVLEQHVTTGKHTSYYLTLSPWGPKTGAEEVTVTKSFYGSTVIGDTVNVHVKKGLLNVPWFYVSR